MLHRCTKKHTHKRWRWSSQHFSFNTDKMGKKKARKQDENVDGFVGLFFFIPLTQREVNCSSFLSRYGRHKENQVCMLMYNLQVIA